MKRKTIVILCLAVVTSAGCATLHRDPNAELVASTKIFTATVKVLTGLKAQGQLGDDEIKDIMAAARLGEKYLVGWEKAIDAGEPQGKIKAAFEVVLEELILAKGRHQ